METVNRRSVIVKSLLWFLVGCGMAVAAARYWRGLGAVTALSDRHPWGLWVGFDVMSGVALAAGGFVLAAVVYIFRLEQFRNLVRPAILTAALGYVAVALGLMVDLGRPWNIWRPMFFWQPHSPLFEVAWCVMLYLTVLLLEFSPVVFEGLGWKRALKVVKKATLGLVIVGIALSTLHQSSLGTLFLLVEDRLYPLWYSPILPVLFFVSAVALGLMMVVFESATTSWLYHREGEWPLLRPLARAAAAVLGLFFLVRFGDLLVRGQLGYALTGSWFSFLFLAEVSIGVVIPILLLTLPSLRNRTGCVFAGSALGVFGIVLHRVDVGGLAHLPLAETVYLPAVTEFAVSLGLVSAMVLIFLFFIERFPVWESSPDQPGHFAVPVRDPVSRTYFGGAWFGRSRLAFGAWTVGIAAGVVVLELFTAGGVDPRPQPVQTAQTVLAERTVAPNAGASALTLATARNQPEITDGVLRQAGPDDPLPLPGLVTALLIDGNGNGDHVLFDHRDHQRRLGGLQSCGRCHHRAIGRDLGARCADCHQDMYRTTDTFRHQVHISNLGGNASCARCHRPTVNGTETTRVRSCSDCHVDDTRALFTAEPGFGVTEGAAPGYRRAMHRLCIDCHRRHEAETGVDEASLSRCATCHPSRPKSAAKLRAGLEGTSVNPVGERVG